MPLKMATVTLDDMTRGGIHDHIGGGFFRYSTDEKWLVPHFEKMLYDNALLLMAYVTAYQYTEEGSYADVTHRSADYILRELTDEQGGSIGQYPASSCFGVLAMMDALYPHRELVCAAQEDFPDELLQYLKENPADDIEVLLKTESNTEALDQCAPFTRDYPVPETGAMYYLCENGACKAPAKSFAELGL